VFDWAREDPAARRLGLITMQVIELALAAALRPNDPQIAADWTKKCGQKPELLVQAREVLGPIVQAWPGELLLAHYGATRGLNTMADVDCLATLGDPWPNLGDVKNQVAFLHLADAWDARVEALCRAELEQAHGRLRVVHRTRPGRALHIGNVMPGGFGWKSGRVQIRKLLGGRPKTEAAMDVTELQGQIASIGGIRAAAKLLGCAHTTLERYLHGRRSIPPHVAQAIRLRSAIGHAGGV
jgi:hypothetical protein